MSDSFTHDFNGAEAQQNAFELIPSGTLVRVRLTIRPGGVGPEGWVTQSRTSDAQYLNTEAVILEGPHARRRVYTRIGLRGKGAQGSDDPYGNRGRALIRGILESARGVASKDTSDRARAARTIRGYGDLNGMEFLARIGVEKDKADPRDEGRNVVAAAIGPEHADYARLMGGAPVAAQPTPPGPVTQGTGGAAPPWAAAQPPQPPAAAGNAPFWAR
ncbi:hypothetical protein GCM10010964_37220 [Caldovatus sediminis]|uniref:Uncharacterized protein n=2 Tax=Acetobacterales TaxID=3120395 RepID=A0A8J3EDV9_9PROT|nr:hypothetical protein [Caldovatus sediminis]GGG46392.1 hypothetical protein GCM10010964_37220 [Caldovatus sediminis]